MGCDVPIGILLEAEDPLGSDDVGSFGFRDNLPSIPPNQLLKLVRATLPLTLLVS